MGQVYQLHIFRIPRVSGDVDAEQRGGRAVRRRRGVRVAPLSGRALHVRGPARGAGARVRARRPARQTLLRVLSP